MGQIDLDTKSQISCISAIIFPFLDTMTLGSLQVCWVGAPPLWDDLSDDKTIVGLVPKLHFLTHFEVTC